MYLGGKLIMEICVAIHNETERGDILTLKEDLTVQWQGRELTVPAGFQCDGASVPRFLWSSVSPAIDPRTIRAAVVHDYLYRNAPENWTRKDADELFYDFIREDGLSWWASQKAYWGVRLFGGSSWKGK
jgi:hypothetical protein